VDPKVSQTDQPYVFTNDSPLNATDPLGEVTRCQGTNCGIGTGYIRGPSGGTACSQNCGTNYSFNSNQETWQYFLSELAVWSAFNYQQQLQAQLAAQEITAAQQAAAQQAALAQYTSNHPVQINSTIVGFANATNSIAMKAEKVLPVLHSVGECANGLNSFWGTNTGEQLIVGESAVLGMSWYFPMEPEVQGAIVVGGGTFYGCANGLYAGG
jgi:hypothetical protein